MHLPDYNLEELAFAFRCYVYFRWHTYYRQPITELKLLTFEALQAIHPELHILELSATETEMGLLVSLPPCESVSVAASKLKGAASKTIRELQGHSAPAKTLGGGTISAAAHPSSHGPGTCPMPTEPRCRPNTPSRCSTGTWC